MKDFKTEAEKIIWKLIEDYHIPEGKSTEEAIDQLTELHEEIVSQRESDILMDMKEFAR